MPRFGIIKREVSWKLIMPWLLPDVFLLYHYKYPSFVIELKKGKYILLSMFHLHDWNDGINMTPPPPSFFSFKEWFHERCNFNFRDQVLMSAYVYYSPLCVHPYISWWLWLDIKLSRIPQMTQGISYDIVLGKAFSNS